MPQPQRPAARLLALDLGSRRTGVALSDELGLYAHPRPAIHHRNQAQLMEAIEALLRSEPVAEVVVGLPLTLAGGDSDQTAHTRAFARELRARLPVPVSEWDERLSSVEAARTHPVAGRPRGGELDSAAAAIILQAILDSRRGAGRS